MGERAGFVLILKELVVGLAVRHGKEEDRHSRQGGTALLETPATK